MESALAPHPGLRRAPSLLRRAMLNLAKTATRREPPVCALGTWPDHTGLHDVQELGETRNRHTRLLRSTMPQGPPNNVLVRACWPSAARFYSSYKGHDHKHNVRQSSDAPCCKQESRSRVYRNARVELREHRGPTQAHLLLAALPRPRPHPRLLLAALPRPHRVMEVAEQDRPADHRRQARRQSLRR